MAIDKRFLAKHGLDNNSNTITNVSDPVNAQDVATRAFSSNASNLTSGTIDAARLPGTITATGLANGTTSITIPVADQDVIITVGGSEVLRATTTAVLATSSIKTTTSGVTNDCFNAVGATTNRRIIRLGNTGGDAVFGIDDNAGGTTIVGASAYDAIVRGASGISFSANAGSALHARLTSGGNVLVGTTTDLGGNLKLQVSGAGYFKVSGETLRVETTTARGNGSNYINFYDPSGVKGYVGYGSAITDDFYINNYMSADLIFSTAATEAFRVTESQRVLIGTTTDNGVDKLQVNGSSLLKSGLTADTSVSTFTATSTHLYHNSTFGAVLCGTGSSSDVLIRSANESSYVQITGSNIISLATSSTTRVRIGSNGNVLVGTTVDADSRLYTRGLNQASTHYSAVFADSTGIAIASFRNDRVVALNNRVLIAGITDDTSSALQVGGTIVASGAVQVMQYLLTSNTGSYIRFGNSVSTAGYVGYTSAGNLDFQTASVSRVHISAAGALLVNTTSDVGSYKLVVNGASLLGGTTKVYNDGANDAVFRVDSQSARAFTEYQLNSTAAAFVGVGSTANDLITGTAIGSLAIRTQGTSIVLSTDSGVTPHAVLGSNGSFGVNVPSPTYRVDVASTNNQLIRATTSGTDRAELLLSKTSGTQRDWIMAVAGTANGHGAPDQSFYIGDVTSGNYRLVIRSDGVVCVGTTANLSPLTVNGAVAITNSGVDGGYSTAFAAYYNGNNVEKNLIKTAVSSTAINSGFMFEVSNGGGSSATTEVLRLNRDALRVVNVPLYIGNLSGRTVSSGVTGYFQVEGTTTNTSSASLYRNSADANGPVFAFGKSRGTTVNSATAVQSGDSLGSIFWAGADGGDTNSQSAFIRAEVDGTPGSNDVPGRIIFGTSPDGSDAAVERMRIDSSGNVMIKSTTLSSVATQIASSSNPDFQIQDTTVIASLVGTQVSTVGAQLVLGKTRGASFGAVQADDTLGAINFAGADGTDLTNRSSEIRGEVDGTVSSNIVPGRVTILTANSSGILFERMRIDSNGHTIPGTSDNTENLGSSSNRWATVYAGTGTINTSDAREKTVVSSMTVDELNAAKQLAQEIGTYKFLTMVQLKGDDARKHIGMTVQKAIEIMQANNLNPFAYGFICYDTWDEKIEDGVVVRSAGDRYSFRPDELLMFISRGFEARLQVLEAAYAEFLASH